MYTDQDIPVHAKAPPTRYPEGAAHTWVSRASVRCCLVWVSDERALCFRFFFFFFSVPFVKVGQDLQGRTTMNHIYWRNSVTEYSQRNSLRFPAEFFKNASHGTCRQVRFCGCSCTPWWWFPVTIFPSFCCSARLHWGDLVGNGPSVQTSASSSLPPSRTWTWRTDGSNQRGRSKSFLDH